jgi:hypothetical protein
LISILLLNKQKGKNETINTITELFEEAIRREERNYGAKMYDYADPSYKFKLLRDDFFKSIDKATLL